MEDGTSSSNTQKKRKNSSDTDPSKSPSSVCEFESRTEEASALQYFQFYGFCFRFDFCLKLIENISAFYESN
uniref:Uncharacterized protein n=1 Tax=Ditylenchus dipsaci TaxID=166011 RepID=A0A915EHF8_9BILA